MTRWRWPLVCAWLLAVIGIAMRVNNAFAFRIGGGFDAVGNWEYISMLLASWTLPAPDAGWSTSHPPLFYYLGAAAGRLLGDAGQGTIIVTLRLLSSACGLVAIAAAVALVRRADPENAVRATLAGGLLLFLPVHVYMSAMLSEEILVSTLASLCVVGAAWELSRPADAPGGLRRAALVGLAGGLALCTKLSGLLAIAAAAGAWALDGLRRRELGPAAARTVVLLAVALLVGGGWYLRNLLSYGFIYPQDLAVHQIMFVMPPGERELLDYLRVPLATFTDPQLMAPGLLRSVWGSTYVTVWFDGHRHFLPKDGALLQFLGASILLLALLPTAAFAVGLVRGTRRALQSPRAVDTPLLLLVAATLAGYVLFSWQNPWFAVLKGSFLLALAVPFAFYASEVLIRWARPGARAALVWSVLGALFLAVTVTFTIGPVIAKPADEPVGLPWAAGAAR